MHQPPAFVDSLLALPIPLLVGMLLAYWGLLAVFVHRTFVPWLAGRDGTRLGRLEAEVPAQIGLAFGLLVSFIAMPVWEQHNVAEEAARSEAAAYREMAETLADESAPGTSEVLAGVGLIHASERRARRVALGMVAIGITCCFVMLFAYARPYLGQFAVQPEDLRLLAADLRDEDGPLHGEGVASSPADRAVR